MAWERSYDHAIHSMDLESLHVESNYLYCPACGTTIIHVGLHVFFICSFDVVKVIHDKLLDQIGANK